MAKDLKDRTMLLTGANTGIGRTAALTLGARGARLYLTARSEDKLEPVMREIRESGNDQVFFLPLELSDLASVRACAKQFLDTGDKLHVLINNAGFAGKRGLTKQGFELTFGVNHLGHFLFTELLLDRLKESAPSRIVIVASDSHRQASGIDWDALRKSTPNVTGLPEYGVSKLCNVLHAKELAERLEGTGVTTYALHPGTVATDAWREMPWPIRPVIKLFMRTAEEGALTTIYCATSPDVAKHTGRYYVDERERRPTKVACDMGLARELRQRSMEWTKA